MDLAHRRAVEPHRGRLLSTPDLGTWIEQALGHAPKDLALFTRALTHGSHAGDNYERLEFLGDRVLALVIAEWLYAEFPDEPEGKLSRRLNALVTRESCAKVGREIGVVPYLRLGKQARDDGAAHSDNVVGDVVEALIGAVYLEGGQDAARTFIRRAWAMVVETQDAAPKHPKSELQEWAASHNRKPPVYEITDRSGPHHSPRFTVTVTVGKLAEASATGSSKQEAETAAARALLEKLLR
ncbi:ribonuclease III [Sphingomonas cavernae]|uniref:Ribonuclease 3 n=1 Tax=Sphingomonas cavernae TaxID=2320861 RepID=A0A418W777_9SPHN|nr:ribonuclease III [Sphingomonas cavernae]RJF85881.1 ribonuclease III [Sphingomonas cavernae]